MKIVTDLDGVLRDLNMEMVMNYGIPYPIIWDWKYNGESMFDYIKKFPSILSNSPKTEYFDIIVKYLGNDLEIWTSQMPEWREYTEKWMKDNLNTIRYTYSYLKPQEKYSILNVLEDYILIEDYPKFKNYDKIILIDRPYNQHVNAKMRVKSPYELEKLLSNILK